MLSWIKQYFTTVDAEMIILQLTGVTGEVTTGRDYDYIYYVGLVYGLVRLGWYIYSRIHEFKRNELDRRNGELENSINEQKLKSWEILNSENFKSYLDEDKIKALKEEYKKQGYGEDK